MIKKRKKRLLENEGKNEKERIWLWKKVQKDRGKERRKEEKKGKRKKMSENDELRDKAEREVKTVEAI